MIGIYQPGTYVTTFSPGDAVGYENGHAYRCTKCGKWVQRTWIHLHEDMQNPKLRIEPLILCDDCDTSFEQMITRWLLK